MTSVFNPYQGPSAEGTLQRGLDESARAALAALRALLRKRDGSPAAPAAFPEPDLNAIAADQGKPADVAGEPGLVPSPNQPIQPSDRRNDDPDPQRAGFETQVVAQTAAVLEKAYGEQGSYQAQNYRVVSVKPKAGPTRYSLYDRNDDRILSFDREGSEISIREDKLSEAQKNDFLEVAQTLDQQGLPETPQQACEVLGAMGPALNRSEYQERVSQAAKNTQVQDAFSKTSPPTPQEAHRQEQDKTPVTAHDLAEWRMASVTLGRSAAQVKGIEAHAQTTAQLSGADNFNQLYQQDKQAPLAVQLDFKQQAVMERDLTQFRDLVKERGPGFVQNLYQLQSQAEKPVSVTDNAQLRNVTAQAENQRPKAAAKSAGRER